MSALPPPRGPSPWPSLPPPVIHVPVDPAGTDGDWARDGATSVPREPVAKESITHETAAQETFPPITVQPATEVIGESVPRTVPSPAADAEVGPVVVRDVAREGASVATEARADSGLPAANAAANAGGVTTAQLRKSIFRRPLFIATVVAGALALIAIFASLRRSGTEQGTATTAVVTAAPAKATTATTVATIASATAATTTSTATAPTTSAPTTSNVTVTTESLPASAPSTAVPETFATVPVTPTTTASVSTSGPPPSTDGGSIPASVVYDGRFNKTFKVTSPDSGPIIVYVSHTGPRTFIVRPLNSNGQAQVTLVNRNGAGSGPFTGSFLVDPFSSLQVIADGSWHVELRSVLSGRQFSSTVSGSGPEVLIYTGPAGSAAISHDGSREFRVEARTADGTVDQLVKAPGSFQGSVPIPGGGFALLVVTADGNWSIAVT